MSKIFVVSIAQVAPINSAWLDLVVGRYGEWVRFTPNTYYVWSNKKKSEIASGIQQALAPGSQSIVLAVQAEAAEGFAPPWLWNWLNDKMSRQFHGQD